MMSGQQEQLQAEDMVFELLSELGNLYLEIGNYDKAVEKLKKLVDLGETEPKAYQNLSKAYLLKKQFDSEAMKIFEKTLEIDPQNALIARVLSQAYLKDQRDDEQAFFVYQKSLQLEPNQLDELYPKIVALALQKQNHQRIIDFINQYNHDQQLFLKLLSFYVAESWKHHAYQDISRFLSQLIDESDNLQYRQLALINLIKHARSFSEDFELCSKDLELFKFLIDKTKSFDSLSDVYLLLAANHLFRKYPIKMIETRKPSIEEYELFLASESFSNIWDLGLNKQNISGYHSGIDESILWDKLKPLLLNKKESKNDFQNSVKEIFDRANSLMLVKIYGKKGEEVEEILKESISKFSAKKNHFVFGFRTGDGYIIFWEDAAKLVSMAEDFLKKSVDKNGNGKAENRQISIVINNIALSKGKEFKYLYDDLEIALSTLAHDERFLLPDSSLLTIKKKREHQLFITSSVKNMIGEDRATSIVPGDITLNHPLTDEEIPIFRWCWYDTLVEIKKGDVKTIGKFAIQKELHPNQIFSSFKAVDSMLERLVILKVLKPGFEIGNDPLTTKKRFFEEARTLGKLIHPQVAMIYEVGEDQNLSFIAREYIEGKSLTTPKRMNRKIDWVRAVNYCRKIAEILAEIHEKGIIHGRLKPENIFILSKDEIKITDFQIPSFSIPIRKSETIDVKSLTYTAPELLDNNVASVQTDVFALGVILYELLTEKNPFSEDTPNKVFNQLLTKTPSPVTLSNSEVPEELNKIIIKSLEKAPVNRYNSMSDMAEALEKIVENNK